MRKDTIMEESIRIALTGDSFITQRIPYNQEKLKHIRDYLHDFDVRFTNFEVTVHHFDQHPSATSGGTWAAARPFVLQDLDWIGMNMMACANNHSLDWLHGGLLCTIEHLEKENWVYAGIGRNLAEAAQPKYLETKNGRVALISITTTFENWHRAGEQRPDVPGRPGINPLGHKQIHRLTKENLEKLKEIESKTEINATRNLNVKEGFSTDHSSSYWFSNLSFEEGQPGTITRMDEKDAERIYRSIVEASRQADLVLVSIHSHEMKGDYKDRPADFVKEFCRACIEKGAHAVIGHGPHILRGIEIYNNRPIFYSLGDFIFQNDTVERQPADFYELYQLGPTHQTADGFDARSGNGTRGLAANSKVFESVIASITYCDGEIRGVELVPISLGFESSRAGRGKPEFVSKAHGEQILSELRQLSSEFGTELLIQNGKGYIEL